MVNTLKYFGYKVNREYQLAFKIHLTLKISTYLTFKGIFLMFRAAQRQPAARFGSTIQKELAQLY